MNKSTGLASHATFNVHIVVIVIGTLALLMNLLSFVSLLCQKNIRRNKYYRVVLSLSLGDLMGSLSLIYWVIRRISIYPDHASEMECLVIFIVMTSSAQQTNLQMLLLAVERFLASRRTNYGQLCCTSKIQITIMTLSWVVCVAYMSTSTLILRMNGARTCHNGLIQNHSAGVVMAVPILLCTTLVLIMYSLTIANIRSSRKRVANTVQGATDATFVENRYVL